MKHKSMNAKQKFFTYWENKDIVNISNLEGKCTLF